MEKKRYHLGEKCIWMGGLGICLLSLLGILKTILVSIDIDESYAIAQAYRLVQGDRMLADMWEPHQLSAYLPALFLKLHMMLTGGTEYAVVALRVWGTVLHLLLAVWLYRSVRSRCGKGGAFLLVALHVNFLAKWVQTPEFELMHYWVLLATALCLFTYYQKQKGIGWLILAGFGMLLQLFNYPSMILLYPFYMLGIWRMGGKRLKEILVTTCAAGIPGFAFVIYLLSYQTLPELLQNLNYVLADPSHTEVSFGTRMGKFALELGGDFLLLGILMAGALVIVYLCERVGRKRGNPSERQMKGATPEAEGQHGAAGIRKLMIQAGLLAFTGMCLYQIYACVFADQNQFFLQERYLLLALLGVGVYLSGREKSGIQKLIFWFAMVPSLVSTVAVAVITNMTMNVCYSKLFLGCLMTLLLLFVSYDERERWQLYVPALGLLGSLLVCKLLLIRVTGCLPVTMRAPLQQVDDGALKGVYILESLEEALDGDRKLLEQYLTEEDRLFIFGCESLLYLDTRAEISVASVQGTSVFNQDFLDYLELHPDKYPTAIAVDKRFEQIWEYRYNPWNYIVKDWIEEEYSYSEKIDTDTMTLYLQ